MYIWVVYVIIIYNNNHNLICIINSIHNLNIIHDVICL